MTSTSMTVPAMMSHACDEINRLMDQNADLRETLEIVKHTLESKFLLTAFEMEVLHAKISAALERTAA